MIYKTYDNYKSSNNNSIGDIPSHWNFHKLKNVIFFQEGPGLRNWQFTDGGIKVICVSNITEKGIDFSNYQRYISEKEYKETYKHFTVNKGDLLISSSGSIGKVSEYISDETVILNTSTIRINTNNKPDFVDLQFVKWALKSESIKEQLKLLMTGAVQFNFGPSHLAKVILAHPESKEEQRQIANYLDKKIAKIDATIAKNEELIHLLEEKRVALINQVVTKGLNHNVPMKDSGIDWIGEIPEHWDINRLKSVTSIIMGQSPDSNDINDENKGILFMQGNADFTNKYPTPSEYCIAPKKISREGDILMSVRAPVGELNISDKRYGIGRGLCSIKPIKVTQSFLWYYLIKSKSDFSYYSNGSTFDAITIGNLSSFPITIPKLNEQEQIGNYLNNETSKIEKIIEKITMNIKFLEEYKTSLIHHVVTGKVDVRGEEV